MTYLRAGLKYIEACEAMKEENAARSHADPTSHILLLEQTASTPLVLTIQNS